MKKDFKAISSSNPIDVNYLEKLNKKIEAQEKEQLTLLNEISAIVKEPLQILRNKIKTTNLLSVYRKPLNQLSNEQQQLMRELTSYCKQEKNNPLHMRIGIKDLLSQEEHDLLQYISEHQLPEETSFTEDTEQELGQKVVMKKNLLELTVLNHLPPQPHQMDIEYIFNITKNRLDLFKRLISKVFKKHSQISTSRPSIIFQERNLPYSSQTNGNVEYKSSEFVIQSRFQNARYLPTYIVLYGETFAGKTQILKNYYNRAPHRNSQQYAAKYWFDAGSKERLVEQYKDMLEENETSTKNLSESKVIKKVKSFLKKQNNCLLVFDNAVSEEILKKFCPAEGNVHVLISSRDANWPRGTYQKIEVPHFIPENKNFIHEREAFQRIEHSRKKENYLLLKTSNILHNLKKGTVSITDEMLLHYLEFLVNLYDSINMKSKVNKKLLINNMSDIAMHLSLFYMTKTIDIEKQQHYLNLSKRLFSQLEDNISELYTEISIIGGQVGWNTSGPYSEQSKQLETLNKKFNKITLSGNKSERKNTSITKELGLALVNFLSTNIGIKNQLVGSKDEVTSITVDISNLENRLKNLTYLNLLDKNHPLSKRYEVEVAIGKLSLGSTLLFSDDNIQNGLNCLAEASKIMEENSMGLLLPLVNTLLSIGQYLTSPNDNNLSDIKNNLIKHYPGIWEKIEIELIPQALPDISSFKANSAFNKEIEMKQPNLNTQQALQASSLLDCNHWYTDNELNQLLNCEIQDGVQAHIYAAQYPFLVGTIGSAAARLFQDALKACFTNSIPGIIPVNCLEQADVDENGLPISQAQVGTHWFLLVVESKADQTYQLTVIDSCGNGFGRDIDITQKNMLDLLSMAPSDNVSHACWTRISRLAGIIDGAKRELELIIKLETIVTGLVQQEDGVNCGPLLIQNSVDWLKEKSLKIFKPQALRRHHANLLSRQHSAKDMTMKETPANYNMITSQVPTRQQITSSQINQSSPALLTHEEKIMNELSPIQSAIKLLTERETLIASDWSQHELIKAIYNGERQRLDIINRLDGQRLYATDGHQNTGQHVAALLGDEATLEAYSNNNLLDDEKNQFGMTSFHAAILNGEPSIIERWLNYRPDSAKVQLTLTNWQGIKDFSLSPLNLAIFMGHIEAVKAIYRVLKQKNKIDDKQVHQSSLGTPLHVAVVSRLSDMLQLLLSDNLLREWMQGFLEKQNGQEQTPLAYAAHIGHTLAIETLVNKGANINSQNNAYKRTALHYTVLGKSPSAVRCLISLGADCSLKSEEPSSEGNKPKTAQTLALKLQKHDKSNTSLKIICRQLENIDEIKKGTHGNLPASHTVYRNAVIQGGGAKGLAYIGAFEVLEREGKLTNLRRVAGTSAGAISALLVALNFSCAEIKEALLTLSVEHMLGHSESELFEKLQQAKVDITQWFNEMRQEQYRGAWGKTTHAFSGLYNRGSHMYTLLTLLQKLAGENALSDGKALELWLKKLVAQKLANDFREHGKNYDNNYQTNLTFKRLHTLVQDNLGYKHLHVFTTDITKQEVVVFNTEEERWHDVNVIEAVCASAALPIVFKPREIRYPSLADPQKQETSLFVDGGLLRNRPIEHFDKLQYQDAFVDVQWRFQERTNQETLGLFLESSKPVEDLDEVINLCQEDTVNVGKLFCRMAGFFYNAEQILQNLRGDIETRRILINVYPTETTDFDIVQDDEKLADLINKGRTAASSFFNPQQKQPVYTSTQQQTHFKLTQVRHTPQQASSSQAELMEDEQESQSNYQGAVTTQNFTIPGNTL